MKLVQKRSKKTGLPPGTLVHIGERKAEKVTITVFRYSTTSCEEQQVEQVDQLSPPADESVIWINVGGVHKVEWSRRSASNSLCILCCWKTWRIPISARNSTTMRPTFFSS